MRKHKTKFECKNCGYKFVRIYKHELYETMCPSCKKIVRNRQKPKLKDAKSIFYHKYKDVTAFGYDRKTGKPVAIDTKGKRISPSETRYDLERDPRGWKAIGKKVKDPSYGRG